MTQRVSLREQGKQARRESILRTAERLIRGSGDVSFSMRELAKESQVAFVTPFNLLGSKSGVLAALLATRLEAERERLAPLSKDSDPIARVFDLASHAGQTYTSDPELFRPLLRRLGSAIEEPDHTALATKTIELWELALQGAIDQGLIAKNRSAAFLARSFHIMFRGALSSWIYEEIDTEEFARQTEYGVALGLLGAITGDERDRLAERIAQIESEGSGVAKTG